MRARFLVPSLFVLSAAGFVGAACGDDTGEGGGGDGAGPAILSCSLGKQECSVLCDPDLGCVECVGDGDCGAASPACIHGHCVQCNDNTDCQMGQSCFPRNGQCEDSCTDNGDCDDDEPICDTATGQCVGCMANADCDGGDPLCDLLTKQCSECLSDGDCGTAQPNCDLSNGECVECAVDSDCADNEICEGHDCHLICQSDVDCQGNPDRPQCNEQTGECVQCITDLECAAPTPACAQNGRCVVCITNNHCAAPTPICDFGNGNGNNSECVECTDDAHCPMERPNCQGQTCQN